MEPSCASKPTISEERQASASSSVDAPWPQPTSATRALLNAPAPPAAAQLEPRLFRGGGRVGGDIGGEMTVYGLHTGS